MYKCTPLRRQPIIVSPVFDAWGAAEVAKATWLKKGPLGSGRAESPSFSVNVPRNYRSSKLKSALDFSVKDASAALPQNCQTTEWILRNYSFCVNVTLVMGIFRAGRMIKKGVPRMPDGTA
jgi:hypothetical protein